MGFEGPRQSIDDIIAGLNDGSIERGDKGDERIIAPDGTEIIYYPEHATIRFTLPESNTTVELSLTSKVISMTEPDTGRTLHDAHIEKQARFLAEQWEAQGLFQPKH